MYNIQCWDESLKLISALILYKSMKTFISTHFLEARDGKLHENQKRRKGSKFHISANPTLSRRASCIRVCSWPPTCWSLQLTALHVAWTSPSPPNASEDTGHRVGNQSRRQAVAGHKLVFSLFQRNSWWPIQYFCGNSTFPKIFLKLNHLNKRRLVTVVIMTKLTQGRNKKAFKLS